MAFELAMEVPQHGPFEYRILPVADDTSAEPGTDGRDHDRRAGGQPAPGAPLAPGRPAAARHPGGTQLIVATHADRLVRFLKPPEVVTFNINEHGATEATRADELELDAWLQDFGLDEVWRMGRMGARP